VESIGTAEESGHGPSHRSGGSTSGRARRCFALWVGSRVVGKTVLSMRAVLVVVADGPRRALTAARPAAESHARSARRGSREPQTTRGGAPASDAGVCQLGTQQDPQRAIAGAFV